MIWHQKRRFYYVDYRHRTYHKFITCFSATVALEMRGSLYVNFFKAVDYIAARILNNYLQGWRNPRCEVWSYVLTFLITGIFYQLSIETRILKIGQYLAKIAN